MRQCRAVSTEEEERTLIEQAFHKIGRDSRSFDAPPTTTGESRRFESLGTVTDGFASLLRRTSLGPGDLVADRYVVERLLGGGVMGQVYLARHAAISLEVAVKLIHPHLMQQPDLRQRFHREAQAIASIQHPSVARFMDLTIGDPTALVMEYVPGPTLEEVLARDGCLSVERALEIAIPLAWGLAAVHGAGIVHRDLKPANIVLAPVPGDTWVPKIIDFGIAKVLPTGESDQKLTRVGEIMGTGLYMAPEQYAGEAGAGSDIYALATILYQMLAGRTPFIELSNPMQAYYKKRNEKPPGLCELVPDAPEALERALARALAVEPAERPASMLAFAGELEAVRAPSPRPVSLPPPVVIQAPPSLGLVVLGAALGAVVGAAATYLALHR